MGYGFVVYVDHGWQYMQAFAAIPAIFMLIMHQSVPESPKWLLAKSKSANDDRQSINNIGLANSDGTYDRVTKILRTVRLPGHDVDREIQDIMAESKNDDNASSAITWSEVFTNHKKAMIIGCGLLFFQVFQI